jgi:hypothetical protein
MWLILVSGGSLVPCLGYLIRIVVALRGLGFPGILVLVKDLLVQLELVLYR